MLKNKKGISLIVLIITILVIIILTSVIIMSFDNSNPIGRANEAKFKSDLTGFRDELMATHVDKSITNSDYVKEDITVTAGNIGKMRLYIPDITEEYANKLVIIRGNLLYNNESSEYYDETEKKWAIEIGIQAPYENCGDADGDGKITENDLKILQQNLDSQTLTAKQKLAYDTDGSGVIDVQDITTLQWYLSGAIDKLPSK